MIETGSSQLALELIQLTRRFGGLVAVNDLSMSVKAGTIHGLIGPNGAGKSTAFDLVSGLTPVSSGIIRLAGKDITRRSTEERVRSGICRTFQTPRLFEKMTALDTVMAGRHIHGGIGVFGSIFSVRRKAREERETADIARRMLKRVGLGGEETAPVGDLPYGKRRLVEIARALAAEPTLLLLDEVTSGLNPVETTSVAQLIREIVVDGPTVILVEHDMHFVMSLCECITVLNFGSRIAQGSPNEIAMNEEVMTAYLGRVEPGRKARRDLRRSMKPAG